jgi:hypothetical protein
LRHLLKDELFVRGPVGTKLGDLVEHSLQERVGRGSRCPCPFEAAAASAVHLRAHPLHLAPDNGEKPKPT